MNEIIKNKFFNQKNYYLINKNYILADRTCKNSFPHHLGGRVLGAFFFKCGIPRRPNPRIFFMTNHLVVSTQATDVQNKNTLILVASFGRKSWRLLQFFQKSFPSVSILQNNIKIGLLLKAVPKLGSNMYESVSTSNCRFPVWQI
jgi:hypothetical protein